MPTVDREILSSYRVMTTSQARVNFSQRCVRDLRDALQKTHRAIKESRALIELSDQLVQRQPRPHETGRP